MNAFFLAGQHGPLFTQYYRPDSANWSQAIIHVPAFAEEMNKSRALVAAQARAWAKMGYAVLIFDYSGSGDSAGEFADASWSHWLDDLHCAIDWIQNQGAQRVHLWGLRLGCLLALDFIRQHDDLIDTLIAWQPVLNGDLFISQFLRLRLAAALLDPRLNQEKVSDLKQTLIAGQALEVAGYELNPDLVRPILSLRAEQIDCTRLKQIAVFEIVTQEDSPSSPALQNWLNPLQQQGFDAQLQTVLAPPFWASQEIATAPKLLAASSQYLTQRSTDAR